MGAYLERALIRARAPTAVQSLLGEMPTRAQVHILWLVMQILLNFCHVRCGFALGAP